MLEEESSIMELLEMRFGLDGRPSVPALQATLQEWENAYDPFSSQHSWAGLEIPSDGHCSVRVPPSPRNES